MIDENLLIGKKGIVVISAPRSGSHWLTNALYRYSNKSNRVLLGEIYTKRSADVLSELNIIKDKYKDKFIFASIVQYVQKNRLIQYADQFKDYYIINLRRRDKVAQYISFAIMTLSWSLDPKSHSPAWGLMSDKFPIEVTNDLLDHFIAEQNFDYVWPADLIMYYEDLPKEMSSRYQKNEYPMLPSEIFSDYELVKQRLSTFTYYDDRKK